MGLTYITARVARAEGKKSLIQRMLVDSGAVYSVLPKSTWILLRLQPMREVEFTLADGTVITRGVSECRFTIEGVSGVSPVVLGGPQDAALLGMVTLETLGLMINPLSRELLPMRMLLA